MPSRQPIEELINKLETSEIWEALFMFICGTSLSSCTLRLSYFSPFMLVDNELGVKLAQEVVDAQIVWKPLTLDCATGTEALRTTRMTARSATGMRRRA